MILNGVMAIIVRYSPNSVALVPKFSLATGGRFTLTPTISHIMSTYWPVNKNI